MYDVNCAITGVSLTYTEAAMVILSRAPGGVYRPAALPVIGDYDYYGGITPDDSRNTELIAAGIAQAMRSGRYWTDDGWALDHWDPSIHQVISNLVRNTCEWLGFYDGAEPLSPSSTTFDGVPLVFALVARPVWEAIVADGEADVHAADAFAEVFGDGPLPRAIYGSGGGAPESELTALAAVDRFLTARGMRWQSHTDGLATDGFGSQHSDEEMLAWLDRARTEFVDDPVVLAGLEAYEAVLTAAIAKECGPPAPVEPPAAPSVPAEARPGGDPRPTASVTCGVHWLNGLTAWMPAWAVEMDLNAPDGAVQATRAGLTVQTTGVYLLTVQMPWEGTSGGEYLMCKVYAEGVQILEATNIAMTTWENVSVISGLVPLTAGQRIALSLIHSGRRPVAVGGPVQGGVQARLAMTMVA
ncbi:hypothetical protein [Tsukamurella pulmonis]|uniref:hypothetical protein n=1 Tax=Tsukamurella pulmonis TaxID=47312 RepID=UPI001EDDBE17|nr:hypothetical protein [Tsukamurella pulmonis]